MAEASVKDVEHAPHTANRRIKRSAQIAQISATRPHVWLVPLSVTAIMMGLGIWACVYGAAQNSDSARQRAAAHVTAAASTMQLSIQDAIMPAVQLADWIQHTLDYDTLQAQWLNRVPDWWSRANKTGVVLAMAPNGVMSSVYPPTAANMILKGIDLLSNPLISSMVIESIQNADITVAAPTLFNDVLRMTFQIPIMVHNVSEAETWGIPFNATQCPPNLCYNAATRTRWWGNAGLTIDATAFVSENGPLQPLAAAGYTFQVRRPPVPSLGETEWVVVGLNGSKPQPSNAVRAMIPVANVEWEVCAWGNNWETSWKKPLIAVVVVASVVCGLLIFAVLLSWQEHRLLLRSILPEATINRMRHEMDWKRVADDADQVKLVEIQTPAQHMLAIIQSILAGQPPPMAMVIAVQQALQRSADVYRPTSQDMQTRIQGASNLNTEVQRALVQQLAAGPHFDILATPEAEEDPSLSSFPDVVPWEVLQQGMRSQTQMRSGSGAPLTKRLTHSGIFTRSPTEAIDSADLRSALAGLMVKAGTDASSPMLVTRNSDWIAAAVDEKDEEGAMPQPLKPAMLPSPEKPILDQLDRVLATANTWDFDPFALEEAAQGRPLSVLGYWLMHKSGCMDWARMDGGTLARFLQKVERGYRDHPFHNKRHAADVLQKFHMILHHGGLMPSYCDQFTLLGCYIAAIVHDYDHRGVSNDFLVQTNDKLAMRYNDRSPMENHHIASAWALLHQPGYNCLSGLTRNNWDKLRKLVIDLVLATDMKQHMSTMGQFSTLFSTSSSAAASLAACLAGRTSVEGRMPSATSDVQPVCESDRLLSLQVALKCADLGNLAAPLPVYLRWVAALEEEYFLQGDAERSRGIVISPLCDRTKEGVSKSQVGFYDFIVLPLLSTFCQKFTSAQPMLKAAVSNYRYWRDGQAPTP